MVVEVSLLRSIFLLATVGLFVGCQPITIRSISMEDCPAVVEVAPVAECEQLPPKSYTASTWLMQRASYCRVQEKARDKKINIGRTYGLSEAQRLKLMQLMSLSCASISANGNAANEALEVETMASTTSAQSLKLFLQQLISDSGWPVDFQALFGLLAEQASQQHQLSLENQNIRLEMQQKIDALMQLERDISNRDVK